jgi:phage terminase large subunit-like protein
MKKTQNELKLKKYIKDIQSGKIVSGKLVKLSVERFLNDIKNKKYFFDVKKFNQCCDFINQLKHYVGEHRGKNFVLEGWQIFIVANIVALYIKGTDRRKYKYSYIQVARKNGKTMFASALSLFFLIADEEFGAEVIVVANTYAQSQILYNCCGTMMSQIDPKCKYHKKHRGRDIEYKITNSTLRTISSHPRGGDGYNPSCSIIDEFHGAQNADIRNLLVSGGGMRKSPVQIIITTAGFNLESVCYQLRCDCADTLNGINDNTNTFSLICELDHADEYTDPNTWKKANPNLGVTVKTEWLKDQIKNAQIYQNEEVNVKTKCLNLWCNGAQTWIPDEYIIKSMKDFPTFDPHDVTAIVGIDLGSTSDLTAMNFLIIKDDIYYMDTRYYLPREYKNKNPYNKIKFEEWAQQGYITLTPGNVTDYDYVLNDLATYFCQIQAVYYDKYNATQFAVNACQIGIECIPYSQTTGNFNIPTKELERLIMCGKVMFKKNPVTIMNYRNVQMKFDFYGNCRPTKEHTHKKIDGVVA